LLADWKEEIARGIGSRKLDRVGRGTVTLHSSIAEDDERGLGAQEMINARTEQARKLVAENLDVSSAALAERCGVSRHTASMSPSRSRRVIISACRQNTPG
jgi:hypothetical protein